jgi:hypothetical protein
MRRLIAAAALAASVITFAGVTPADATPLDTAFDRTLGGCDYKLLYRENAQGRPQAAIKIDETAHPSDGTCEVGYFTPWYYESDNSGLRDGWAGTWDPDLLGTWQYATSDEGSDELAYGFWTLRRYYSNGCQIAVEIEAGPVDGSSNGVISGGPYYIGC